MKIKTRFAPSPTGDLHIGGVRTALFNYAFAKKNNGLFVIRIEDTDISRSTKESTTIITSAMDRLSMQSDEPIVLQSQNTKKYQEIIDTLLKSGNAYKCYCNKQRLEDLKITKKKEKKTYKYDGKCRYNKEDKNLPFVVRFKNPQDGRVEFDDLIKGKIIIENSQLDDFIIARSDGTPTYNLCVVVDDITMKISHVIRGDDHLSNTPKQINIYKSLGANIPKFAHLPMILGEDGKRLSKRHGASSVLQYLDDGFLPSALINYLARLGWSHNDLEFFMPDDFFKIFNLKNVNKSAAIFDPAKLLWLNQQHIQKTDKQEIADKLLQFLEKHNIKATIDEKFLFLIEAFQPRAKTLVEMALMCKNYYKDFNKYDEKAAKKNFNRDAIEPLECFIKNINNIDNFQKDEIKTQIQITLDDLKIKMPHLGMPLRAALTGGSFSPSIEIVAYILGKQTTIKRIKNAIKYIEAFA
ncbi:MAG: glutamate--tRNA ligase [Gammaproteobacteria bacterium]|nr:MAG: glutamate--tRNA ligase [Gammaproteobacteria bacterium]